MRFIFSVLLAVSAYAAACVSTEPECTEWIRFASGPAQSLVYRTFPLDVQNEKLTRALIVIHGSSRDAEGNFRSALAAGFLAGALDDTLIISPRVASNDGRGCRDVLAVNEVNWSCSGDSWRSGGASSSSGQLTSYDFADEILRKLARKQMFPNLKTIVLAGHSAGGQFVTRYAMGNRVDQGLGVAISYVVANPSSYAYLDASRPTGDGAAGCANYDQWPYGLENRKGYTAKISDEQLKKQLAARPVTYLLGEIDILPLGGFDGSCPAMAQGPTRKARGEAYANYVNQKYGARHKLVIVPLCGHNGRCMYTADVSLPILFPKP
jgi:pimeloyl-ACP methyl ester carboxylesterase